MTTLLTIHIFIKHQSLSYHETKENKNVRQAKRHYFDQLQIFHLLNKYLSSTEWMLEKTKWTKFRCPPTLDYMALNNWFISTKYTPYSQHSVGTIILLKEQTRFPHPTRIHYYSLNVKWHKSTEHDLKFIYIYMWKN